MNGERKKKKKKKKTKKKKESSNTKFLSYCLEDTLGLTESSRSLMERKLTPKWKCFFRFLSTG